MEKASIEEEKCYKTDVVELQVTQSAIGNTRSKSAKVQKQLHLEAQIQQKAQ